MLACVSVSITYFDCPDQCQNWSYRTTSHSAQRVTAEHIIQFSPHESHLSHPANQSRSPESFPLTLYFNWCPTLNMSTTLSRCLLQLYAAMDGNPERTRKVRDNHTCTRRSHRSKSKRYSPASGASRALSCPGPGHEWCAWHCLVPCCRARH